MTDANSSRSLSQMRQIDSICGVFERVWESGQVPDLRTFLPTSEPLRTEVLVELVRLDLEYRWRAGEAAGIETYIAEYPELATRSEIAGINPPRRDQSGDQSRNQSGDNSSQWTPKPAGSSVLNDSATIIDLTSAAPTPEDSAVNRTADGSPQTVGEYEILETIGRGGMGYVAKARHRTMKRLVAVKFILPNFTASTELRQRFVREVEAAARLDHPNIVTAYDAGTLPDGTSFLVMKYVEGDNLSKRIRTGGPLSVAATIDVIRQVARGMAHAHDQHIVHRDIKPSNLLIAPHGVVQILDLGLARMRSLPGDADRDELTNSGSMMGTVDYMAPEQAMSARDADHRADIYSLGCTLYCLLTGQPPFASDSMMSCLLAHRDAEIPSLHEQRRDIPEELEAAFRKMLAKRPEDRFQSMLEVADELARIVCDDDDTAALETLEAPTGSSGFIRLDDFDTPPATPATLRQTAGQMQPSQSMTEPASVACDPSSNSSTSDLPTLSALNLRPSRGRLVRLFAAVLAVLMLGVTGWFAFNRPAPSPPESASKRVEPAAPELPVATSLADDLNPTATSLTPATSLTHAQSATPTVARNFALRFQSPADAIQTPVIHDGSHPLTIEVTVAVIPRADGTSRGTIFSTATSGRGLTLRRSYFPPDHKFAFIFVVVDRTKTTVARTTVELKAGRFQLAAVLDGQTQRLFVDGTLAATNTDTSSYFASERPLKVGNEYEDEGYDASWPGTIDEIRISRIARYESDYEAVTRLKSDADTIAIYHLDEGEGDTLHDASGNDRHATRHGALWVPDETGHR